VKHCCSKQRLSGRKPLPINQLHALCLVMFGTRETFQPDLPGNSFHNGVVRAFHLVCIRTIQALKPRNLEVKSTAG